MIVLPFRGTTLEIDLSSNGGAAFIVRAPNGDKAIAASTARAPFMVERLIADGRTADLETFMAAWTVVKAVVKAVEANP